jgi:predicted SAM-dependent methyltransferase
LGRKVDWLGAGGGGNLLSSKVLRFVRFFPSILLFRRRRVRGYLRRAHLIRSYLASARVARLQLGAAGNEMDGWLNTSLRPRLPGIVFLDAAQPFPFDDGVFDYILSEHLVEHLPFRDGKFMLAECFRVLKQGGVIRLSTPDLAMLGGLFSPGNHMGDRYVRWIASTFRQDVPIENAAMVVNNLFYNWGHRFLYDFAMLKAVLDEVGFKDVLACEVGLSDHAALNGVEQHLGNSAEDGEMSRFEALVVEATRP